MYQFKQTRALKQLKKRKMENAMGSFARSLAQWATVLFGGVPASVRIPVAVTHERGRFAGRAQPGHRFRKYDPADRGFR